MTNSVKYASIVLEDAEWITAMLLEKPIAIPENPFWHVFKRFGRDEIIALIVNAIGTIIASFFIQSVLWLSMVGPVIEKIGFFPAHFFEALKIRRTTPLKRRKKLTTYLIGAFRGGLRSLIEDICVHDPTYVLLFLSLNTYYTEIPLWVVVFFSFVAAILFVAVLEVSVSEAMYSLLKLKLKRARFDRESFLEARFLIKPDLSVENIASKFKAAFPELVAIEKRQYKDVYFENKFPFFSGRIPVLRLRKRTLGFSDEWWIDKYKWAKELGWSQSVQLVYTRSREERQNELDQFRFFPVEKDKFCFMLKILPEQLGGVEDEAVKKILMPRSGQAIKSIAFDRVVLTSGKGELFVAIDISPSKSFYIIEMKAWGNAELLVTAMRFAMAELPVTQTTQSKINMDLE